MILVFRIRNGMCMYLKKSENPRSGEALQNEQGFFLKECDVKVASILNLR